MNKTTYLKILFTVLILVTGCQFYAQNLVPFNPRYDQAIKGDILLIGNSNVGIHVSDPYNGTDTNDRINALNIPQTIAFERLLRNFGSLSTLSRKAR